KVPAIVVILCRVSVCNLQRSSESSTFFFVSILFSQLESRRAYLHTPYDPTNHPSSRAEVFCSQLRISCPRTTRSSSGHSQQPLGFVHRRHTSNSYRPSPAQSDHISKLVFF